MIASNFHIVKIFMIRPIRVYLINLEILAFLRFSFLFAYKPTILILLSIRLRVEVSSEHLHVLIGTDRIVIFLRLLLERLRILNTVPHYIVTTHRFKGSRSA